LREAESSSIAEELSRQTRDLVSKFESRASSFSGRADLAPLMVGADSGRAVTSAFELFGEGEHVATGVDGSMDFDERLQMMLFYANASAYSCPLFVGRHLEFDLDSAQRDSRLAASAAVPLWADDLSSVFAGEPEMELELEHSMEKIPNAFMTLGEVYLAFLALERSRVVFVDRPISGTFSALSRDSRNLLRAGGARLPRWDEDGGASGLDFELAIRVGPPGIAVPRRRGYLRLALFSLLAGEDLSYSEASTRLDVGEADVVKAGKKLVELDKAYEGALLSDRTERGLRLREEAKGYWGRAQTACLRYAKDVFSGRRHPLALSDSDYLTVLDVSAAALILLQGAVSRSLAEGSLLIGVAKDTTATDISRAVLPYASACGLVKLRSDPPRLKSDKAFLAILSSENPGTATPWRTPGYDGAFSSIFEKGGELIGARKVVSREQLFVRSYFQLRTLRSDPTVRSQVFLFDRAFDGKRDSPSVRQVEVRERSGPTTVAAYFEGKDPAELSNLALHLLSLCDNPEVFEAFGHNQLLYLADKAVKAEVRLMRSSLRGVADLMVGGAATRRKIFGLATTYRHQRAEAEHARMRG
jgi:hypothetical protein